MADFKQSETTTPPPPPAPPAPPAAPQDKADTPAVDPKEPVQVEQEVFLAARLRETLAELANLRDHNADLLTELGILRKENAKFKASVAQIEINKLDADFNVGQGTVLQRRPDGTYWRVPTATIQ